MPDSFRHPVDQTAAVSGTSLTRDQGIDFLIGRKTPQRLLGKFQIAVNFDLEHAARSGDELDLARSRGRQPVPRTEGLRLIVSLHAVFDLDVHSYLSIDHLAFNSNESPPG